MPGTLARGRLAAHPLWQRILSSEAVASRVIRPLIVSDAVEDRERVEGAAGLERISITEAVREARAAAAADLAGVLVYGVSGRTDEHALIASQPEHVVPRAVRAIKDAVPDLVVATDVCVCAYTTHGQCVLFAQGGADIAATLERLTLIARAHADAGADLLIPSGMLDGSVAALRGALAGGHADVPIAAMAAIESGLYATHRRAVGTVPVAERAVPLLDPHDAGAALARIRRDAAAGADAVVVAPGLLALDVVAAVATQVDLPVASYNTAAEHALFALGSEAEIDAAERDTIDAARRAGADLVISHAGL